MFALLDEVIPQIQHRAAAYVLMGCDQRYLYKGACRDLYERLEDHRAGRATRTKNRRPLRLVHHEYCAMYEEALKRERYLKSGYGRIWLKRLVRKGLG